MSDEIDDLSFPNEVISRLMNQALDSSTTISKQARAAMSRTALTFILYIIFPWFGMDISETLVKLVYFKPLYLTPDKIRTEVNIDSHRITILHLDSRPLTDTSIGKSL
ncbi:unnamed protein product [Rotaria sp. Silwood2]|nr:unnamed protein product [Rotaria sp. Silwood2]